MPDPQPTRQGRLSVARITKRFSSGDLGWKTQSADSSVHRLPRTYIVLAGAVLRVIRPYRGHQSPHLDSSSNRAISCARDTKTQPIPLGSQTAAHFVNSHVSREGLVFSRLKSPHHRIFKTRHSLRRRNFSRLSFRPRTPTSSPRSRPISVLVAGRPAPLQLLCTHHFSGSFSCGCRRV